MDGPWYDPIIETVQFAEALDEPNKLQTETASLDFLDMVSSQHPFAPKILSEIQHAIPSWWSAYPSENFESVGMIIPFIWKNNITVSVPNHQPDPFMNRDCTSC